MTQSWMLLLRLAPWRLSELWHWLHLEISTTVLRSWAMASVIAKLLTTPVTGTRKLKVPLPGTVSTAGWPSIATAPLPVTVKGIGTFEVTVKVPFPLFTAPTRGLMEIGWAGAVVPLPVFVYSLVLQEINMATRLA